MIAYDQRRDQVLSDCLAGFDLVDQHAVVSGQGFELDCLDLAADEPHGREDRLLVLLADHHHGHARRIRLVSRGVAAEDDAFGARFEHPEPQPHLAVLPLHSDRPARLEAPGLAKPFPCRVVGQLEGLA